MTGRSLLYIVAVLAMVCSACKEQGGTRSVRQYDVMVLEPSSRELSSNYSATIRGKQDIDIRPKVSGYITDIYVREGSVVTKGQPMFVIDKVSYEAALQNAIANVDVAKAAVEAAELTAGAKEQLHEQGIISDFELQMARTTLDKEKGQLALARANEVNARNNLSYTVVKSPADGIVGTLPFRVGTLVSPSDATPMTSVSDNSEMYVYFSMTESQVLSLTRRYGSLEGALSSMPPIELQLSDGSIYSERGRIEAISGIIDATTGSVTVRAKFPNRSRLLLSGGSGNVLIPYSQSNCLVIPQSATFEIQDKIYVYKVQEGKARSQIVGVFEISNAREYIIESGCAPGDTIVVEGTGLLREGAEVNIRKVVEAGR